nr:UDP-N-acetylmuramoyl-L-alanyl-D-glutamate--2,6-diaminopimelate ligase [Halotalea alkalilenta]
MTDSKPMRHQVSTKDDGRGPLLVVGRDDLWTTLVKRWPTLPRQPLVELPERFALHLDARRLRSGEVFIARPGVRGDGRAFIAQALDAGASLVLAEAPFASDDPRVLVLDGLNDALGDLVAELAGIPESLLAIAVTGTNGKSSVTHYIAALSQALGTPAGLMGTLGVGRVGGLHDTGLTTPDPLTVAAVAAGLAREGVVRLALEASSHALDQRRLDALSIRVGVFTNLTRDHLDYHHTMLAYAAAKAQLFRRAELELAVVNADDPHARLMVAGLAPGARLLRVGAETGDFRVLDWAPEPAGQRARLATPEGERGLSLALLGRFNLDNALLAIATLYGLGEPLDAVLAAAARLAPVPGRMERVVEAGAPLVVVDYAHTPDALDNALSALRSHTQGRLWCLVGCGGDRDPGKRPMMAGIGARLADRLVITDDNPRSESAAAIRTAMREGVPAGAEVEECGDRRVAIERTIAAASPEDVVLIAGKGHEGYQEIQGVRHPFSDLEIARSALALRGTRGAPS